MFPADMVTQKYGECFWGEELDSKQGLHVLLNRNRDGSKMCQEFEEYLKKRSKIEKEFSESLSSLKKCFTFKNEEHKGDLEKAFDLFQTELTSMANSHRSISDHFSRQAESVKIFRDSQHSEKKKVEADLRKANNEKLTQLSKTKKLENAYKKKCQERSSAEIHAKEMEKDGIKEKDIEKAKSRLVKAKEDAEKADSSYRGSVVFLEETTTSWEKAMESSCESIQELDEKRIKFLRGELWVAVNADSKVALDVDNLCEIVRKELEKCDIKNDIQVFLGASKTGFSRPKHYQFKEYTESSDIDSDRESSTGSIDSSGFKNVTKREKIFHRH